MNICYLIGRRAPQKKPNEERTEEEEEGRMLHVWAVRFSFILCVCTSQELAVAGYLFQWFLGVTIYCVVHEFWLWLMVSIVFYSNAYWSLLRNGESESRRTRGEKWQNNRLQKDMKTTEANVNYVVYVTCERVERSEWNFSNRALSFSVPHFIENKSFQNTKPFPDFSNIYQYIFSILNIFSHLSSSLRH